MPQGDNDTAPGSSASGLGAEATPEKVAAPEFKRGTQIRRYVVLEKLRAGGMGVVYAAYDDQLDRRVALKLLAPDGRGTEEARHQAKLNHPNVVVVHDVDTFADRVFIAMEFMAGGTLREWLGTPRDWREVLRLFIEAGEGLAAAHALSPPLLHRDFKPDNVLLDAHGHPRVSDFGLAREAGQTAVTATAIGHRTAGTPGYIAPEQIRGGAPPDPRSDDFSFCVALYDALFGKLPFGTEPHVTLPPLTFPRTSPVPGWVRSVLTRGLSERPEDRYPSTRALLHALRADPARRRRNLALATLSLAVVGAAAASLVWLALRETPEQRAHRECVERAAAVEAGIFGPAQQSAISRAFTGAAPAHGAEDFERIRSRLAPEASSWRELSQSACRLKDPEARKQLESCLEERRKTLQSISTLFASADAKVVENALTTVLSEVLPAAGCRGGPPPADESPAAGESDAKLREDLAKAHVLRAAGKYDDAQEKALEVAGDAREQQSREVEAEAELLVGELFTEKRRSDAEVHLKKAILLADGVANDELRANAWLGLVNWYTIRGRTVEPSEALKTAQEIVSRLGAHPLLRASYLMQKGALDEVKGHLDEARESFGEAVAIRRRLLPPDHPLLLVALTRLALVSPPGEGRPVLLDVLHAVQRLFGPDHPETAAAWQSLGTIELRSIESPGPNAERCSAALDDFTQALTIREKTRKSDPARLGRSHAALARALERCDQPEASLPHKREAVQLLEEGGATEAELLWELFSLRDLLLKLERPQVEVAAVEATIKRVSGNDDLSGVEAIVNPGPTAQAP